MSAPPPQAAPSECYVPVEGAELYCRQLGQGRPLVVVHGGPDFDHTYLLPDMDRLGDGFRLVYYDQRGRGRSRGDLRLPTLGIEQYVADLERLLAHLQLERVSLLGHSFGALVAMHYALHAPERVERLVLLNTAPATHEDYLRMQEERGARRARYAARLRALATSDAFRRGDPATVAAYYRLDFTTAFARPELVDRLRLSFTREDILRGREIDGRLLEGLYWTEGYSLLPRLRSLRAPTLVLHGDADFVPVPCARRVAETIPGARLVVLPACGHFAYLESPEAMRRAIDAFVAGG